MRHVMAQKSDEVRKINTAGQLDKETGLLVNFITDLEDKYSAQVAKLGLTAFVTNLKEANERVRMLLTSSMRHPKQKSHLDGSKSDLIARCFSVRKSVFVK